jgi:hypothetical protein
MAGLRFKVNANLTVSQARRPLVFFTDGSYVEAIMMRINPRRIILLLLVAGTSVSCLVKTPAELSASGDYRGALGRLKWVLPGQRPGMALAAGREAFFRGDYAVAADFFDRAGSKTLRDGALNASAGDWISALNGIESTGDDTLFERAGDTAVEYWIARDEPVRLAEVLLLLGRDTEARAAYRQAGDRYLALQAFDLAEKAYRQAGEEALAGDSAARKVQMARRIEKGGRDIYRYLDTHLAGLSEEKGIAEMLTWLSALEEEIGGYNTRLALQYAFTVLGSELGIFEAENRPALEGGNSDELEALNTRLGEFRAMAEILARLTEVYGPAGSN